MAELNDVQYPSVFRENQVTHLRRSAEVIIIKRVRNFFVPGGGENIKQSQQFRWDFEEFLKDKTVLRPHEILNEKWEDPDSPGTPLYHHYQVTMNGGAKIGSRSQLGDVSPATTNDDVFYINATTTTEGRGRCTIKINSRNNRYIFQNNPLKKGKTVFESNDMVFVSMTGLDNEMHRVFTGKVTSINTDTATQDNLDTVITLICDDMLKPLFETRGNERPSQNVAEARGKVFRGLTNNFSDKLPHEIVADLMARAYADLLTVPGHKTKLETIRAKARTLDPIKRADAALEEEREIQEKLAIPTPSSTFSYSEDHPFVITEGANELSALPKFLGQAVDFGEKRVSIPTRIYGIRRRRTSLNTPTTARDEGASSGFPLLIADPDDLAFVIEGTVQPIYKAAFTGQTNIFASEWKSSLSIIQGIANNLHYEVFADAFGIVRFRPLNVTLPHDFNGIEPRPTKDIGNWDGRVGYEFWLRPEFIGPQSRFTDTDQDVFTIAYVFGDYQATEIGAQVIKGAAVDARRLFQIGERMAPATQRLNLLTDEACSAYARSYLSRLNAVASSGQVTYIGDSRLRVGNPCYVPHRNEIYYITSVTHEFIVGQGYKTHLTLKYGRRPLGVRSNRLNAGNRNSILTRVKNIRTKAFLELHDINLVLDRIRNLDQADTIVGLATGGGQREADYIEDNLEQLSFKDYVWEPMYPLTYDELVDSLIRERNISSRKEATEDASADSSIFQLELQRAKQASPTKSTRQITVDAVKRLMRREGE